jgi:uncharacterized protein (DUF302 family)
MSYAFTRKFENTDVDSMEIVVRSALAKNGFGVLTEIDVSKTLEQKIGADLPPYLILGACNPHMAYQAIGLEPRIGAMLPCNVILRQVGSGVEVSAVDPVASMTAIDNAELMGVAIQVKDMLHSVVREL